MRRRRWIAMALSIEVWDVVLSEPQASCRQGIAMRRSRTKLQSHLKRFKWRRTSRSFLRPLLARQESACLTGSLGLGDGLVCPFHFYRHGVVNVAVGIDIIEVERVRKVF